MYKTELLDKELEQKPHQINEKPRICCIDIEKNTLDTLEKHGFNLYSGTFGKKINVPNKRTYDNKELLLNFNFPQNLHEYDIFIIDLNHSESIDYNENDHLHTNHTGKSAFSLGCMTLLQNRSSNH